MSTFIDLRFMTKFRDYKFGDLLVLLQFSSTCLSLVDKCIISIEQTIFREDSKHNCDLQFRNFMINVVSKCSHMS